MSKTSKQRKFVKQLRANGLDVVQGSKHLKVKSDGRIIGVLPHAGHGAEGFRAMKNVAAQVRRETGVDIRP